MMTTNFNHIINDNIDMFDESECQSIAEQVAEFNAEMAELEAEYQLRAYAEEVGQMNETDEGYAEAMALYSDMYKDVYGHRPYGIGLRYHFSKALSGLYFFAVFLSSQITPNFPVYRAVLHEMINLSTMHNNKPKRAK